MRTILFAVFLSCIGLTDMNAQTISRVDASPLDMAIFRPGGKGTEAVALIVYSRPRAKGRKVFGELVPYDRIWRLGANETTELDVYQDITIEGQPLAAGRYTMYAIPGESEWTIIINSKLRTWGAYEYEEERDVMRFTVASKQVKEMYESFGMAMDGNNGKGKILIAWENTEVHIEFNY